MTESYTALSDDDLIGLLSTEEDRLPRAAVDEILRRGARLAPVLLRVLDDREIWESSAPDCVAPVHAAFILAKLQPPGVFGTLLRAVRFALELDEYDVGDVGDSLLAACGPSALPPLIAVASDADEILELRLCATEAIARIALAHPGARDAGKDHLKAVAQDEDADDELRMTAAAALLECATPQDEPFLRTLTQEDFLRPDDIREALAGRHPPFYANPIDWLDFYSPRDRGSDDDLDEAEVDLPDDPALDVLARIDEAGGPPAPIVNASRKVGRNDPCPCGSGKKFKKCCGA